MWSRRTKFSLQKERLLTTKARARKVDLKESGHQEWVKEVKAIPMVLMVAPWNVIIAGPLIISSEIVINLGREGAEHRHILP